MAICYSYERNAMRKRHATPPRSLEIQPRGAHLWTTCADVTRCIGIRLPSRPACITLILCDSRHAESQRCCAKHIRVCLDAGIDWPCVAPAHGDDQRHTRLQARGVHGVVASLQPRP